MKNRVTLLIIRRKRFKLLLWWKIRKEILTTDLYNWASKFLDQLWLESKEGERVRRKRVKWRENKEKKRKRERSEVEGRKKSRRAFSKDEGVVKAERIVTFFFFAFWRMIGDKLAVRVELKAFGWVAYHH